MYVDRKYPIKTFRGRLSSSLIVCSISLGLCVILLSLIFLSLDTSWLAGPLKQFPELRRSLSVLAEPYPYSKLAYDLDDKHTSAVPMTKSEDIGTKQEEVIEMMQHAWKGYNKYAWGMDHLKPVSKSGDNWFGLGLTIIDAMDTLYIMGLDKEYQECRDWVQDHLTFDKEIRVNLFETTIRVLGGLLSTYHLTKDELFLEKATELGDILLVCFETPTGIPFSDVFLNNRTAVQPRWTEESSTAEVATVQLEFRYLSFLTNDDKYTLAVEKVIEVIDANMPDGGLVKLWINPTNAAFKGKLRTLGARGDSYYEYLLKMWLQTDKSQVRYRDMYIEAMASVENELLQYTAVEKMPYISEYYMDSNKNKMDHLVCFLPGTLALGAYKDLGMGQEMNDKHLQLAKDLVETCMRMYKITKTGLAPEITYFNDGVTFVAANTHSERNDESNQVYQTFDDLVVYDNDVHNLLRPETVESLYYLYKITKDKKYQQYGYDIMKAFNEHCRISTGGFSSVDSVFEVPATHNRDKMETFFLGETLKYLFLLLSDDVDKSVISIDTIVFNTEAHALPILPKRRWSWLERITCHSCESDYYVKKKIRERKSRRLIEKAEKRAMIEKLTSKELRDFYKIRDP